MNSFQILDRNNEPISINQLDQEAASFWGKEVDKKYYANPFKKKEFVNSSNLEGEELKQAKETFKLKNRILQNAYNWHTVLAKSIPNITNSNWECVTSSIIDEVEKGEELKPIMAEIYQPFLDLIKHWEKKGYTPKSIN